MKGYELYPMMVRALKETGAINVEAGFVLYQLEVPLQSPGVVYIHSKDGVTFAEGTVQVNFEMASRFLKQVLPNNKEYEFIENKFREKR